MGCSNSREFEIEDATLNPKMLEEDALARIHADMTMWTKLKCRLQLRPDWEEWLFPVVDWQNNKMFHYCSNMGGTLPLSRMVRKRGSHDLSTADLGLLGIVSELVRRRDRARPGRREVGVACGVLRLVELLFFRGEPSQALLSWRRRRNARALEVCCFHCEHLAEEVTKIAHVAEKFGALLAVDAEVDGIDRRGSTGVHGHFEWTFFCAASRRNAAAGRDFFCAARAA